MARGMLIPGQKAKAFSISLSDGEKRDLEWLAFGLRLNRSELARLAFWLVTKKLSPKDLRELLEAKKDEDRAKHT